MNRTKLDISVSRNCDAASTYWMYCNVPHFGSLVDKHDCIIKHYNQKDCFCTCPHDAVVFCRNWQIYSSLLLIGCYIRPSLYRHLLDQNNLASHLNCVWSKCNYVYLFHNPFNNSQESNYCQGIWHILSPSQHTSQVSLRPTDVCQWAQQRAGSLRINRNPARGQV